MKNHIHLLQLNLNFSDFRFGLLCFVTAFVVTLIAIPPIISLIKKYRFYDLPNARKEHTNPIPTMGGVAIIAGMMISLFMWFPFSTIPAQLCFFLSVLVLLALGIMDDLKDLAAKYKFLVQLSLAVLIALSGIRITSLDGLFGIYDLSVSAQYTFTILAIVGITNAFNLIDGIDGLAGGLGFMSLIVLGLFLTLNGDANTALISFALGGGILAFLYFNLNPARIFMGDTGSLVLGFVIAILCIRLMQVNLTSLNPALPHAASFIAGLVLIPVFDTIRVFGIRIWKGRSPFVADKTHIHHLLTNQGFSHGFSARFICFIHGFILMEVYWLRNIRQELSIVVLLVLMLGITWLLKNLGLFVKNQKTGATAIIKAD
ncbi:MAG: undecaprenyl/decaprenyl-phosphate alpha-N-acetylglucosaminyl 1-phosphate transferase [Sphingobacteriales bacterium]|nr:undecaprenyl/decaprenyl-phosphate alpha-N-acetylglucosaminyl 1-phosphate transferase [Sphingobacteriales bacterium]